MDNRARLFRIGRSIPYILAVIFSLAAVCWALPEIWEPAEGSHFLKTVVYAFLSFLMIISLFLKGSTRSILVLVTGATLFSVGLVDLVERLREFPIRSPDGGPIATDVWIALALLGLFLAVVVIEAAGLIGSRSTRA